MSDDKKPDNKLFETAKKRFKQALADEFDARQERLDDLRFSVLLEQWDPKVKAARESDPNGGRPCLTIDKTNQYIRQIVNGIRENPSAIKMRATDDTGSEEVADIYAGLARHIEDQSRASIAYEWAAESAVRCGLGYFRILTGYTNEDSFDQEIQIKRVLDVNSVVLGPHTEPDGSDAKWGFIIDSMSKEDFEAEYPDAEAIDFSTDTDQEWFGEERVIVAEYFYLVGKTQTKHFLEDGSVTTDEDYKSSKSKQKILRSRKATTYQCMWAKLNGKEILEEKEFPANYIPLIPVTGNEGFVDKRVLSGVVRAAKDSQRLYNYSRSAFTEAVALAPKAPYIAAAGQIEEFPEWKTANTKNHSVLRYKPVAVNGAAVGAPQRQQFAGVPAGLSQDMEIAERDIQSTMGLHEASKGEMGAERSGIAIQKLQSKGDTSTYHYGDNLARSIQHGGRIIAGMIPRVYDSARTIRIIGEDGEADYAHIDPEQKEAVQEQLDEQGALKKVFNLGIGSYDVVVSVGPSYSTKRMEFVSMMADLFGRDPALMQLAGDLYFRSIDMPYADQIADRLKKMLPPPLQDKQEGQEEIPPAAQAQINQMNQALHMSEQQMQQYEQQIRQLQFEQKAKTVEINGKIEEANIRAQAELAKAMAELETARVTSTDPARMDAVEQSLMILIETLGQQPLLDPQSMYLGDPGTTAPDQAPVGQMPPAAAPEPPPEQPPQQPA